MIKAFLMSALTVLVVVMVGCMLESFFLYFQVTRGVKLPFRLQLFPVLGSD